MLFPHGENILNPFVVKRSDHDGAKLEGHGFLKADVLRSMAGFHMYIPNSALSIFHSGSLIDGTQDEHGCSLRAEG